MNTPMLPQPEPSLSANIYCAGHLDAVIFRCIAPFWRDLRSPGHARIRMLRYELGGEHLKIRIHAPESMSAALGASLESAVRPFLALGTPPLATPPAKKKTVSALPLDVEDDIELVRPDRSFLWTHHRRNVVEFGGKPLLDDDEYISRMVLAHAEATEFVLHALMPDQTGNVPFHARQNTLLRATMTGIAALPWSREKRSAYFAYHRDWLLRFILTQANQYPDMASGLVERFDRNLGQLGPGLEIYRNAADAQWNHPQENNHADASWHVAMKNLADYLAPLANDPHFQIDPFAPEPMFSALFKVFHLLANQLGVRPNDEAFAHHLLLTLSGKDDQRHAFAFDPPMMQAFCNEVAP